MLILQRVDDILQFIQDFTVDVEGVGHVCRLVMHHHHHFRHCHLLISNVVITNDHEQFYKEHFVLVLVPTDHFVPGATKLTFLLSRIFLLAALVCLIFNTMVIAIMVHNTIHFALKGVHKGKWRNHS